MAEPIANATKLDIFYDELREKLKKNNGVAHVKLSTIPFNLDDSRMGKLKKLIVADFGHKIFVKKNNRSGLLVVDTTSGDPAPSKKPAYVNNSSR